MLHSLKTITDKVVVRIMAPQRCPHSNPGNLRMCYSPWYEGFAGVIKSRILRWRHHPGLPRWAQCTHMWEEGRGGGREHRSTGESGPRKGSTSKGCACPPEAGGNSKQILLQRLRRKQPCGHLDFTPTRQTWSCDLQYYLRVNLCFVKPLGCG